MTSHGIVKGLPVLSSTVSSFTHIGSRPTQEDRLTIHALTDECVLLAVFDGTVGDTVSEAASRLVVPNLIESKGWMKYIQSSERTNDYLVEALKEVYARTDAQILELCKQFGHNYSSSTAVIVLVTSDAIVVSHVGDSRACLVSNENNSRFLTSDHGPANPSERKRIEANGGSVVLLSSHNTKPYLRGGDFLKRKLAGEQAMQLQYSRALGGKDLKPFGLTAEPDISVHRIDKSKDLALIIASDGLWDIVTPEQAKRLVCECTRTSPAEALVQYVLKHQQCTSDNITDIVLMF